jgi:hypothetical protein
VALTEPVSVGDTDADTDTVGATLPLTLDEDVTEALADGLVLGLKHCTPLPSPPHTLLTLTGRDTKNSSGDDDVATPRAIVTGTQLDVGSATSAALTAAKLPD